MAIESKIPPLKCWGQLKELNNTYDEELITAKQDGRLLAFTTGFFPMELLEAFDVAKIQGEWYGSRCGFAQETDFADTAEACGFPHEICSYARMSIGSMIRDRGFSGPFPTPDFLVGLEGLCNMHVKWVEIMSRYLNVPLFVMDMPTLYLHPLNTWGYEAEKDAVEYFVEQEYKYIDFAEQVTGKKVNEEKLIASWNNSRRNHALWDEIMELWRSVPSPVSIKSLFTCENLIVSIYGREETIEVLTALRDELKERVEHGISGIPDEKYRLMWHAQPPWFDMGLLRYFEENGAAFVCSPYLEWFGQQYLSRVLGDRVSDWMFDWMSIEPSNLDETLRSLAKCYLLQFIRPRLRLWLDSSLDIARRSKLDGLVWHFVRACKTGSAGELDMRASLWKTLEIPGLIIEGSPADTRDYSRDQTIQRIDTFMETLARGKG